jgi:hypothetical protein
MKRASKPSTKSANEVREEYRFDYRKARPNRFANRPPAEAVAVILDPDVAAVFHSSEAVNTLLRSVIAALPDPDPSPPRRSKPAG